MVCDSHFISRLLRGTLLDSEEDLLVSIGKKILAVVIALSIIGIVSYGLLSQTNQQGGEGGLRSPSVRTFVTLAVVGGSAFITGFGLRDVIGRAVATRNRNRLKSAQEQKRQ